MRYLFYLLTVAVFFAIGMIVGNLYLPDQSAAHSAVISVPDLPQDNPVLQTLSRDEAEKNLTVLNQALSSCPVVVAEEKDRLVNRIKLLLAVDDFELKKTQLEMEMAKNIDTNRPTAQFVQATTNYNTALENVTKLAEELFPVSEASVETATPADGAQPEEPAEIPSTQTQVSTTAVTQ